MKDDSNSRDERRIPRIVRAGGKPRFVAKALPDEKVREMAKRREALKR